jgi:hypothetical protein
LVELTPKSVNKARHTADVQAALEAFFAEHLARWSAHAGSALSQELPSRGQDVRAPGHV